MRREHTALTNGSYVHLLTDSDVFAFERHDHATRLLIALNFATVMRDVTLPADAYPARMLLSTCLDRENQFV